MNGYETYTREELVKMDADMMSNLRQERWAAEGTGLRADVARSNVRTFEKQLTSIRSELQKRKA